jgi:diguanylate cyclase (GGDEF)-like protein
VASDVDDLLTLRTIIGVQRAINSADPTADAVMRIVVSQALEATQARGAVVELAEGDEMVYTATAGSLKGTEGLRLKLSGSLSGRAVRTGEVLVSQDTELDDRVDLAACRRVHARSMIVVPLLHRSRTLGVLKVSSDRPKAFGDNAVDLLEQLAEFIATALGRAAAMDERSHAASTDNLTGLANRGPFLAELEKAIATAASSNHPVAAVLYLDLDRFKPINDTYGHAIGDEVLRAIGNRIKAKSRASDLAARIGGDEFAVLLTDMSHTSVMDIRDALIRAVCDEIQTSAGRLSVGVSCGLAVVGGEDLAESVLARADAAMYADKRARAS